MSQSNPKVTIKDKAASRDITMKNGQQRKVWYQPVVVDCEQFRVTVDMDIDDEKSAHPIGARYEWDVVADLVPGAFASIDLARRMTLIPLSEAKPAPKAA